MNDLYNAEKILFVEQRKLNWSKARLKGSLGGRISSVVSSTSTTIWPQVWIPSTLSTLFQFEFMKLQWEKDENKQRGRDWPIFKKSLKSYIKISQSKSAIMNCPVGSYQYRFWQSAKILQGQFIPRYYWSKNDLKFGVKHGSSFE